MNNSSSKPRLLVFSHGELLGDALLKLPALTALRPAFPDHHISWLAGTGFTFYARQLGPLVETMIDEVREDVRLGQSLKEFWHPPLRNEFYDVIIDTQNRVKSTLLLKHVPHRLFVSPTANFFFSDRKPAGPHKQGSIQRRLLQLIGLAGGCQAEANFTLYLPEQYRSAAARLLPAGRCYIGLAPGSGVARKCWPLESFIDLAGIQADSGRTPVFFLGPKEAGWQEKIAAAVPASLFPEQEPVCTDDNTVLLSLALAERINAGVANDSGTGHIFATAGQPLISLFGHSNAEKFVHESHNRTTIFARNFGGTEMHRIPVTAVAEAIDKILNG